jgi:hypothetical protein
MSKDGIIRDTPITNPLDAATRTLVAEWFGGHAALLHSDMAAGPPQDELAKVGGDVNVWRQRIEEAVARLRRAGAHIGQDTLVFDTAADIRNLLEHAEDHRLTGATAALDQAIEAVLPKRRRLLDEVIEKRKRDRGFHIIAVGGRGEPLPLPPFAYTEGLSERARHPDLVTVGFAPEVAGFVLGALSEEVLAGERTLTASETVSGVLDGDYELRVTDAPEALAAQLPKAPQHRVLQILLPDVGGRFPGDPDVDAEFANGQQYPDHLA